MSQGSRWISVHFLGPAQGFGEAIIVIVEHTRQGIEQIGSKFGAIGFRETERQGFDFSERDHGRNVAGIGGRIKTLCFHEESKPEQP